jgi:hypothetical protein
MKNLTNPKLIWAKGILFLLLGFLSATLLVLQHPSFRVGALLVVVIWSFCRFYYLAFYVIEHYLDSEYRFSGLFSFVRYAFSRKSSTKEQKPGLTP